MPEIHNKTKKKDTSSDKQASTKGTKDGQSTPLKTMHSLNMVNREQTKMEVVDMEDETSRMETKNRNIAKRQNRSHKRHKSPREWRQ